MPALKCETTTMPKIDAAITAGLKSVLLSLLLATAIRVTVSPSYASVYSSAKEKYRGSMHLAWCFGRWREMRPRTR